MQKKNTNTQSHSLLFLLFTVLFNNPNDFFPGAICLYASVLCVASGQARTKRTFLLGKYIAYVVSYRGREKKKK